MEILDEKQNDVFNRKEIVVAFESQAGTPSRQFVTSEVCKKLVVSEECVVINRIQQRFGRKLVKASVKVYSSPEDLKKFEPAYRKARPHPKKAKEEAAKAPTKHAEKKPAATEKGKPAEKKEPAEGKPVEKKPAEAKPDEKEGGGEKKEGEA